MTLSARKVRRVALGMSGGVDSSTSAVLLMDAGYDVVGVTCRFHNDVSSDRAAADAAAVCEQVGIPHVEQDCTADFRDRVILPFVHSYERGLTPSPCVCCNALCKMPTLLDVADQMGCEYIATGHYARIAQLRSSGRFVVKSALDARKDQSYMLSLLNQQQLSRLILPLGGITKPEVRVMAADSNLLVAEKPESQDVCFYEGDYRHFLYSCGIRGKSGPIVDRQGNHLGTHEGLHNYTVGQRKGIGVSSSEALYVLEKNPELDQLVVGFASQAFTTEVGAVNPCWQAFDSLSDSRHAMVKLRYRSLAVPCLLKPAEKGNVRVVLQSPQPITAPGQYAVFYEGDTVLGGAMIQEVCTL